MTAPAPLKLSAPSRPDAVVVDLPVVLAPMAGVTNAAYRQLCREQGAGLYVCEMITSRGLVVGDHKTRDMLVFDPGETTRSVQLYGVDPDAMAQAARILVEDYSVQHIDLNFGCPVPKVTRKGGGGVLPYKRALLRAIVGATVRAADDYGVPVTIKTRIGIDDEHHTFLDAGKIAQDEGAAAIALHGRTVQQSYSGSANWDAIAELKQAVEIPVLGNGDIWEAEDALTMMEQTGCDGVVIGRGCLGRPWLFKDLAAAFAGETERRRPTLGEVGQMLIRHAELLTQVMGPRGIVDLRKHMAWYFKGYPIGGDARRALAAVSSLAELDENGAFVRVPIERVRALVERRANVLVTGAGGSGKTTLTALPARLYDVTGGRVLLDGVDVRELTLDELRTHVAMAFEDATLFSASVRENVLMGAPEASEEALERALAIAQAGFARDLPNGLETEIGEEGLSLSGGQRQRLARARAVAAAPAVLVLDDPLSALDVETEALVEEALRSVLETTTALIVAHRPSTVQLADRVALMRDGRIDDVGTHAELLARSEHYRYVITSLEETERDRTSIEAVTGAMQVIDLDEQTSEEVAR